MFDLLHISLLALFLFAASVILYSWIFSASRRLPPGPLGLPVVGYLPFLRRDLHRQFSELANNHGPIFKLWLGSKICVVMSSPELIKQVVSDHDAVFANRDVTAAIRIATKGCIDIGYSPLGPRWREIRKLFARQVMNHGNLAASSSLRSLEVGKAIRSLGCHEGKPVGIGELIFQTEMNLVLRMIWGGTVKADNFTTGEEQLKYYIEKIFDLFAEPNVSDFFPFLERFDFQGVARRMREFHGALEEFMDYAIKERQKVAEKAEREAKKDFLGILLELQGQRLAEGSVFGWDEVKVLLMDIVVGGTDTTATTVEWVMAELLQHPEIMEKVQGELTEVVGIDNAMEESHIEKLHYLDAVVKETFRLHPPVPMLIPRAPSQSCIVGGYEVPKDSKVFLNIWAVHTNPDIWENPLEFRPERFLLRGEKFDFKGNNYKYLPFGSGRRICPGILLAERMVMYFVGSLVHLFRWQLRDGEEMELSEKFGLVMRKKNPLYAVPYRRSQTPNLYE